MVAIFPLPFQELNPKFFFDAFTYSQLFTGFSESLTQRPRRGAKDFNVATASWSAAVLCRFGRPTTFESGRGLPHSRTLTRCFRSFAASRPLR